MCYTHNLNERFNFRECLNDPMRQFPFTKKKMKFSKFLVNKAENEDRKIQCEDTLFDIVCNEWLNEAKIMTQNSSLWGKLLQRC